MCPAPRPGTGAPGPRRRPVVTRAAAPARLGLRASGPPPRTRWQRRAAPLAWLRSLLGRLVPGAAARSLIGRLVPSAASQALARRVVQPLVRHGWLIAIALVAVGLGYIALERWSQGPPPLVPRHRPEALCFALAQPPAFAPPMRVEPSAALVRGRFTASTPAAVALQEVMDFSDLMVVRRWTRHVGGYDVCTMWLRLPDPGGV